MTDDFAGQLHPAPKITMERAQEIVREETDAWIPGFTEPLHSGIVLHVPIRGQGHFDNGPPYLNDGQRHEPARLDSEDALRAQCRNWRR